jgi:hypothetical protein
MNGHKWNRTLNILMSKHPLSLHANISTKVAIFKGDGVSENYMMMRSCVNLQAPAIYIETDSTTYPNVASPVRMCTLSSV